MKISVILSSDISSLKLFKLNSNLCLSFHESFIDQIINKIYDKIKVIKNLLEFMQQDYFNERVILSSLNYNINELND